VTAALLWTAGLGGRRRRTTVVRPRRGPFNDEAPESFPLPKLISSSGSSPFPSPATDSFGPAHGDVTPGIAFAHVVTLSPRLIRLSLGSGHNGMSPVSFFFSRFRFCVQAPHTHANASTALNVRDNHDGNSANGQRKQPQPQQQHRNGGSITSSDTSSNNDAMAMSAVATRR